MSTPPHPTAGHSELLREAGRLYRQRIKPALKSALLDVKPNAVLHANDYVVDVEDNLLPGLRVDEIKKEFGSGAGGELKGKMRAPWSSSALAVNSFLPWRAHGESISFLGLGPLSPQFKFEAKCPNKVSGTPPDLDVLLRGDNDVVGVESKCTEFTQGSQHTTVSERYLNLAKRGDPRASSRWFAALGETAALPLLDSYQLIKHYLGLRETYPGSELTLAYLYWEPPNAGGERVFVEHRAEVNRFGELVAGDASCPFVAASYLDVWREWAALADAPEWLGRNLDRLGRRYAVAV